MQVPLGDTYYFLFTTRSFSTGAPATLSGTPVLSVYEENNLTQITSGVSVSADYDSVTGLNQATVVATSGNGYEAGKYYDVVITTGTVGGVSVVGEVVGHFRIMPAEDAGAGIPDVNVTHVSDTAEDIATETKQNTAQTDLDTLTGTDGVTLATSQPNYTPAVAGDSMALTAAAVDAIWDEVLTGHLTANTAGLMVTVGSAALIDSTVTGTPTSTTFDFTGGNTNNNFYNDQLVYILSGTGAGQVRTILSSSYTGGTTTITVDEPFIVTPAASDRFAIKIMHIHPKSQIADSIWDEATSGHSTAGTTGKALTDTLADTNELQGDWANGGRLDVILDTIAQDTTTDIPALIAALNDLSAAQVNAEVVDVLKTDTIAEMAQQAPPATPTFEEAVMYLYMALRNKLDITATLKEFHNDAGTVIWKKTLSDDGTTYSEAEGATGP